MSASKMEIYLEKAKHHLGFVKSRVFRRIATVFVAFSCVVAFIIVTARLTNVGEVLPKVIGSFLPKIPTCVSRNESGVQEIWKTAEDKYKHLMNDKFTIAMQTYQRPKELNDTLHAILSEEIPSLHEIVIVWNDLKATPPDGYTSKHGVPVRFRVSKRNSLNEKLWPDPDYKTQAILLSDDDVYYHPKDLEFVFQSWRKFGQHRLTGALARCSTVDAYGNWAYDFCSSKAEEDIYSMVLTNLCFSHISFLDYYSANETTMNEIRDYVDEGFNCEDIALNYVQSLLTGDGPLLVQGREKYVNFVPSKGISTKKGHLAARSRCLNDFAKIFECMPLIDETAHIQKGVLVM
ncbi:glycosyl transferase family 64 domain-containing protein [Ilyonectria destructans]|nr:glycosyl transferase family 64 domain-containing protein [Ilyonectria destructans]